MKIRGPFLGVGAGRALANLQRWVESRGGLPAIQDDQAAFDHWYADLPAEDRPDAEMAIRAACRRLWNAGLKAMGAYRADPRPSMQQGGAAPAGARVVPEQLSFPEFHEWALNYARYTLVPAAEIIRCKATAWARLHPDEAAQSSFNAEGFAADVVRDAIRRA